MPEIGDQIDHYKILSAIGAGGMGEVFLAHDTKLDRKVALKILPAEFAADHDRMSRFVREAKSASALNHPNIITIYEIGESDGTHFIATEFIDGKTLSDYAKSNPPNFKSALEIAIQVASALDEAHVAGIVHRDIKPDNVMVRANGLAKILDFGIAKLSAPTLTDEEAATAIKGGTSPGMVIGTANYMSPEQAKGGEVDARSDIFSFGIVLYEMIAGDLPFEGENALSTIGAILHKEPKPLGADVPPEIAGIIGKCLRKDRDERYQTIKDAGNDLIDVKQELEFQNKLERTVSPDKAEPKTQILQAATADETKQTVTNQTVSNDPKIKYLTIGLAILLLSALGLFAYRYFTPTKQIESIAVLPFENASGNTDLDYLSDGVSESVIDRLSQLPQLKVIARSSSFRYRGANLDLKQIADALGVQTIVTGRVIPRGDSYQIRVELIDVRENKQLWGENFTRKSSDVQILQADISREIAENLRLRLSGTQTEQLVSQGTTNPQAYELLLKARFYFNKSGPENFHKAVEYWEQAIAADPSYALAYAELSNGYNYSRRGLDRKQARARREAAARKALELDPNLAEAHLAMAGVKLVAWEWQEVEREYKRAIELNPNLAFAHAGYAEYLSLMGRNDEALAEAKRALEINPLSLISNGVLGLVHFQARRYDEAIEALKRRIELDNQNAPFPYRRLGDVYMAMGMYEQAVAAYQEAIRIQIDSRVLTREWSNLGAAYAKAGNRAKAEEILQKIQTGENDVSSTELAVLYDGLSMRDEAFAQLEKAYAERLSNLPFIAVEPAYDNLRSDPRFKDLLKRMNLPE